MYFITVDCTVERNVLVKVLSDRISLLCQFHVMWAAINVEKVGNSQ